MPQAAKNWLVDVTTESGLDFVHESGDTGEWHMPEIMGAGAALFDADGDGRLDIYLTNGAFLWGTRPAAERPVNRLYTQSSGGRFVDATEGSGLGDPGYGMGVAVGDIDNDGDLDVYVTNVGPDRLYRNRGDGTFEDATEAAGVRVESWSVSATFLDFDRDGWLDLYVSRYVHYDPTKRCTDGAGRPDYCGPKNYEYLSDVLLRNRGDGTYADVSETAGIAAIKAPGLGVTADDYDDDGWIDVYVANDLEANQLWINQHDGTFRDMAVLSGAAYNINGQAESGMGVLAADLDNDRRPDLFMTHLKGQTNTVYRNLAPILGFSDVTGEWGLAEGCVPYTGFGTVALDVELDGDLDLLVANGRAFRGEAFPGTELPQPWNLFAEPNLFYVNDGAGRFTPRADLAETFCGLIEIGRGLVTGDIDADGDLDVLLANIESPARIFHNDAERRGPWLVVRAIDPALRRDAIGARVTVLGGRRPLTRSLTSGFSYLSASEPAAHFGLGDMPEVTGIEIRWPDGSTERFPKVGADQKITLFRGNGEVTSNVAPTGKGE